MATNAFGLNTGNAEYPTGGTLIFGSDYAGRDFVTPMARFSFYDSSGNSIEGTAPTIYIKMPGTFNSTLINSYQEATNIFGRPGQTGILGGNNTGLGGMMESAGTSLQRQVLAGFAGAEGFITSFGLSGRTQVEFLTRTFLNNFQQLVYQGPTFRRYQLPFSMRPTSEEEASQMLAIIQTFRVASSPTTLLDALSLKGKTAEGALGTVSAGDPSKLTEEEQAKIREAAEANSDQLAQDLVFIDRAVDALAFSYPDMCKFDIVLDLPGTGIDELATIFQSEFCMIESVAVDYGSQNKMQFFEQSGDGLYYPTDVTLSLSLREAVLTTAGLASEQYDRNQTIL